MTPLEQTTQNQRRAADPARSAFVMANAGAGKTRVLTDRVARLLLAKTRPERILCITFTKAAAAEMADRLFETLGAWALAEDATLIAALEELEGKDAPDRDAAGLADARRLFAQALETPGGLKIQTIHAFCEQVLRRFPLEAGVPPGFTVLEDSEAVRLLNTAIDTVAVAAHNDASLTAAFARLSALRNENDARELMISAAGRRLDFEAALARFDGLDGMLAAAAAELDVDPHVSEDEIRGGFIRALPMEKFAAAQQALSDSGKNAQKLCAAPMQTILETNAAASQWDALQKLFIKTDGGPRGKYGDKTTEKTAPWVDAYMLELEHEFLTAHNAIKALVLFNDTAAWLRLADSVIAAYARLKSARAALDFDDLIDCARAMLKNTQSAWVMYKLDQGIDHALIDEAQDTSPAQWDVIEALFDEFLSGAGARETKRSFFAVGDMKQSIYSFLGADAGLFKEKETELGKRLEAVTDFESVSLSLSFRTVEPVLAFVDALYADKEAADGLGGSPIPEHFFKREGEAGRVEIWPLTPRPDKPETNAWDAPVDEPSPDHPVRVLSERIAATVKTWRDENATLESQARPIAPGDIMILVQSRGPLFDDVIRALAGQGVAVAGADRLKLLEDPAIEDLLSYARFAAFSEDDLSLAETLKSPLFGFDDDTDIFPLAYERRPGQCLWQALNERANEKPQWRRAVQQLAIARSAGLREGPYAFLSHILETGSPSGRLRFYARLTQASRDAVDEMLRQALDFESAHPRSLRGFINWFQAAAGEIKREMERPGDAVRVMTVHGAKGLEANIVFLIDAQRTPNLTKLGPVFELTRDSANATGRERLSVLAGASERDIPVTREARAEKKRKEYEEYRRQLYVAATRARDRLYICGVERGNDKNPRGKETGVKSWHALAEDAFDRLGARVETLDSPFWENSSAKVRRISCMQTAAVKTDDDAQVFERPANPSWLFSPAPPETAPPRLAPSRLAGEEELDADTPAEAPAMSPIAGDKYFRGRTLHRLLELLPDIEPGARAEAADRLLARLAPHIAAGERARWRDEALAVLADPQFADAFGSGSRAEVAIAGAPKGAKPGLFISGQIDRLVVRDKKILVIDYKTNRPPPKTVEETAPAYIAQMAAYRALLEEIYPHHEIESALLWTFEARLMPLPEPLLDHAFARYVAAG